VAGSCEHGSEHASYVKRGEFLDHLFKKASDSQSCLYEHTAAENTTYQQL
jgi:hypothetical protein